MGPGGRPKLSTFLIAGSVAFSYHSRALTRSVATPRPLVERSQITHSYRDPAGGGFSSHCRPLAKSGGEPQSISDVAESRSSASASPAAAPALSNHFLPLGSAVHLRACAVVKQKPDRRRGADIAPGESFFVPFPRLGVISGNALDRSCRYNSDGSSMPVVSPTAAGSSSRTIRAPSHNLAATPPALLVKNGQYRAWLPTAPAEALPGGGLFVPFPGLCA